MNLVFIYRNILHLAFFVQIYCSFGIFSRNDICVLFPWICSTELLFIQEYHAPGTIIFMNIIHWVVVFPGIPCTWYYRFHEYVPLSCCFSRNTMHLVLSFPGICSMSCCFPGIPCPWYYCFHDYVPVSCCFPGVPCPWDYSFHDYVPWVVVFQEYHAPGTIVSRNMFHELLFSRSTMHLVLSFPWVCSSELLCFQEYHAPGTIVSMNMFQWVVVFQEYHAPGTIVSMSMFHWVVFQEYHAPGTIVSMGMFHWVVVFQEYLAPCTIVSMNMFHWVVVFPGIPCPWYYRFHEYVPLNCCFPGIPCPWYYRFHEYVPTSCCFSRSTMPLGRAPMWSLRGGGRRPCLSGRGRGWARCRCPTPSTQSSATPCCAAARWRPTWPDTMEFSSVSILVYWHNRFNLMKKLLYGFFLSFF